MLVLQRPERSRHSLGRLSEQSSLTHPTIADLFRNICENCDLGIGTLLLAKPFVRNLTWASGIGADGR